MFAEFFLMLINGSTKHDDSVEFGGLEPKVTTRFNFEARTKIQGSVHDWGLDTQKNTRFNFGGSTLKLRTLLPFDTQCRTPRATKSGLGPSSGA